MKQEQNVQEVTHISEPLPLTKGEKAGLLAFGTGFLIGGTAGLVSAITGQKDFGMGLVSNLAIVGGGVMLYSLYKNKKEEPKSKTKVK